MARTLSISHLNEIRNQSPRIFESLYQQNPTPQEGAIIKSKWFKTYGPELINEGVINFFVDTAFTNNTNNDPSAIIAYWTNENYLYIKHCTSGYYEFPELIKVLVSYTKQYGYTNASRIIIEPKASGLSVIQELKKQTNLNIVEGDIPTEGKITRVNLITAYIESGKVLIPDTKDQ